MNRPENPIGRRFSVAGAVPLLLAALAVGACASAAPPPPPSGPNRLSAAERAAGWRLLFDGETTRGWHVYGKQGAPGWTVEDGALVGLGSREGGDLVSDEEFQSFELSLEWKISPGGNSGVFFHVVEDPARYPGVHYTGPEYQLIDDEGFPQRLEEWQKTGANYAMHDATSRPTRPVGEWNRTRIVVDGPRVEHWLNGVKVVEYELWSADWEKRVGSGKWKDAPDYARAGRGRLALQDHGGRVYFRDIKVRPLS